MLSPSANQRGSRDPSSSALLASNAPLQPEPQPEQSGALIENDQPPRRLMLLSMRSNELAGYRERAADATIAAARPEPDDVIAQDKDRACLGPRR